VKRPLRSTCGLSQNEPVAAPDRTHTSEALI
jgi:hypothetical protein